MCNASPQSWHEVTQLDKAQEAHSIAIIFRVPKCYAILSIHCDIFGWCMLLTKTDVLTASYMEPEFSFTFTNDLFNLKTSAT
jgi:hypothetical protein